MAVRPPPPMMKSPYATGAPAPAVKPSSSVQRRSHLSSWMSHNMKPVDPYGGGAAKSRSIPPIGRVTAVAPKVTGAGISETNTGGEWAGTLYKPSYGEQKRAYRRKGYFNNPDKDTPRKPPKGAPAERNYSKAHSLGMKRTNQPPIADPLTCSPSDVLAKCYRSPDVVGNRYFTRNAENDWVSRGEVSKQEHKQRFKREAIMHIHQVAKRREAERVQRLEEKRKAKAAIDLYDPWAHEVPSKARNHKVTLDLAQQRFDEQMKKKSWVGTELGKMGGGAPTILPNGKIKTAMKYDAETHLRNAYKSTQNSGDAVMTYARQEHYDVNKKFGDEVKAQRDAVRARKRRDREMSDLQKRTDVGMVHYMGRAGAGAANRTPSGKVNTKVQGAHELDVDKKRDFALGEAHRRMIKERAHARAVDKNPQRYDKFEKYDPFEKAVVVRDADGKIKGTRSYTVKGVGLVAPDVKVEGATLANSMGTPGGGARSNFDSCKMVAAMGEEEINIELDAQRRGVSQWGREGGGGPLRRKDGSIETRTRGTAELQSKGIADARADPHYRSRMQQIKDEQESYLKQKYAERKRRKAEEKAADAATAKQSFMAESTNPHHSGPRIPTRFAKPRIDFYGRKKKEPNRDLGKAYDDQIAVRQWQGDYVKDLDRREDDMHTQNAGRWQGKGAGQVPRGPDGQPTGHFQKSLDIHPGMRPDDNMVYSSEVRAEKEKYHAELTSTVEKKKKVRFVNRRRKAEEEAAHKANDNKFLGRPGAGAPIRLRNGKIKTQRGGPPGDVEYKMMAVPATALL